MEDNLKQLNTAQLKSRLQLNNVVLGMFILMMIVLLGAGLYLGLSQKKSIVFLILPVAMIPLIVMNLAVNKRLKSEIQKREV